MAHYENNVFTIGKQNRTLSFATESLLLSVLKTLPSDTHTICTIFLVTAAVLGPKYMICCSWICLQVRCIREFLTTQACRDWVQTETTACEVKGLKSSIPSYFCTLKKLWGVFVCSIGKVQRGCKGRNSRSPEPFQVRKTVWLEALNPPLFACHDSNLNCPWESRDSQTMVVNLTNKQNQEKCIIWLGSSPKRKAAFRHNSKLCFA